MSGQFQLSTQVSIVACSCSGHVTEWAAATMWVAATERRYSPMAARRRSPLFLRCGSTPWLCNSWWELWNFSVVQLKFNRFLQLNEPPKRIFLYLVRCFDWRMSKVGHFQFSKSILEANLHWILLKIIFLSDHLISRATFISRILNIKKILQPSPHYSVRHHRCFRKLSSSSLAL